MLLLDKLLIAVVSRGRLPKQLCRTRLKSRLAFIRWARAATGPAQLFQSQGMARQIAAETAEIPFSNLVCFMNSRNFIDAINTII